MIFALRGGYIAASSHVNIPMSMPGRMRGGEKLAEKTVRTATAWLVKDAAGIRRLYKGLDPKKRWWPTARPARAPQTYAVLREMGYQRSATTTIRGSSGARTGMLPAKNVSYFDFVKVNAAMKKLEALEKRVAALEPKK